LPVRSRACQPSRSACQASFSRPIVEADRPGASGPSSAASASLKSPLEDALEVQPGQQLLERAGPPQVARQDRRGEPDLGVRCTDPAIAHPGLAHRHLADAGLDGALGQEAVPDQAPAASVIDQIGVARKEGLDFGFNRLRQQRARPVPQHLRQRILRSIVWATEADHVIFVHGVSDPSAKG
jgi:hypothetical protein